jgi:hypothetical protein
MHRSVTCSTRIFPGCAAEIRPAKAIRGPTWLYVEYANGEKAYHDLAADPDELHNTYSVAVRRQGVAARHGHGGSERP